MFSLKIRDAAPEDIWDIVDIAVEAFWREYGSREKAKEAFSSIVTKRWESMIRRGSGVFLVAEENGQIIGFLIFRWWFGWYGWLEAIAVREDCRGKGIGTRLVKALIDKARRQGYTKICLAVGDEGVVGFYEKFGARCFGRLPDEGSGMLTLYYISLGCKRSSTEAIFGSENASNQ